MARKARQEADLELVTLYEVGKILTESLDLQRTCRDTLNVLAAHLGIERAVVVVMHENGHLHLLSAVGLTPEEALQCRYAPGEGITGRIYSAGTPVVVPDIANEKLFLDRTGALARAKKNKQVMAMLGVPLKIGRRTVGVLTVHRLADGGGRSFNDDLRLLSMVAHLMGHALSLNRKVTEERSLLERETKRLHRELRGTRFAPDNAIGTSKRMREVFAEVERAAAGRSTVLLRGESGTGKEMIARTLHGLSPRKDAAFVAVNCAALSETLLETELFGHEKGAFTGAAGERKGRFELAHGGTLFLDEIGDISPAFQAKLLRVLQEREFERVGGTKVVKVDVRLVCATNRNLEKMVAAGEFRADLYYRINVISIFLPPLRERREDIPPLVAHFLERFNRDNDRELRVNPDALKVLVNCYWPGNVRELENCIERTATMTRGNTIEVLSFPCHNDRCLTQTLHDVHKDDAVAPAASVPVSAIEKPRAKEAATTPVFGEMKPEGERDRLVWALERSGWVQAKAARLLNITPRQMGYALQKHGIEVRRF
ncbi:MAG: nif-specific transcriptional activator NifA [Betaproteobacteria bacterium]|nr:nif-specific transcriptional activator NifA [Betaproteobacteria bacterium]